MAHYQLFLPGSRHSAPNDGLTAVGLDGLVRPGDRRPASRDGVGPGHARGTFVVWQPNDLPGFWPARQTWFSAKRDDRRGLAAGRFWIGFDDHSPPTPADLRRDEPAFQGGLPTALGDGSEWTVPRLHWIFCLVKIDARDQHASQAVSTLAALVEARARGDEGPIFRLSMELCVSLLAFNYRVTAGVCSRFGLLQPPSVAAILEASCQAPRIPPNLSPTARASRASE